MKSTLAATLLTVAFSITASAAHVIEAVHAGGASTVVEMQQRKHDTELREQLSRDGRWEEIRKLDERSAQRLQSAREQRYVQVNAELAHGTAVEGQLIDARALNCDADKMQVR